MFSDGIINVLLIEDEEFDVRRVQNTIKPFSDQIKIGKIVSDGKGAIELLKEKSERFDLVIMDFQIAGGLMGEELIHKIKEIDAALQIIVVTKMTINISDYAFANKLMKAGAFWYCTKYPGDIEEFIYQPTDFIISIFNAFEKRKLELERLRVNQKLVRNAEETLEQKRMVGESPEILKLKEQIAKCSQSTINVLIRGASGTGKELVAYNIHYTSARKLENFVIINCGSLPHDLVESELFGYEKGAFTGADKKKLGLFEVAHNGTIFLDEVTELPLAAQVKLLRVIQDGEIEKIGRTEKIKVDVRILAATNRNIEEEVKARRFREDLYYRLNVLPIHVPDLKYRKTDIPILLDHFMMIMSIDMIREKPKFEEDAMKLFIDYDWPGNVRELKNVVQRLLFNDEKIINLKEAKLAIGKYGLNEESSDRNGINFDKENILPLRDLEVMVREKYFSFVRENSSSDTDAAKKLGLAPPNYFRMAKELGMK
ncbi:MAG: transcriptional regulator [Ignavibacteria bacterium CG22_combo_CG10-13_8_21_14_all_37_15]|nr:sigma-54-dependent Fis family transcriptional regulator [Ignavibacteria bacterium]OIO18251.1 MAG: transcriptional regulator [Ignavibacteria bacterium CG1_02_37_35]PIP76774.1 MAG: transcriptional regulator [Ignavibacteria bacterium CG22_combo_CG10-13_8_21_14_all_37_15]PIS44222.1 MAG: sigma-54-dependent Fis family transcriptional regulator [Ignavibacteria bacterium CG08_land_8_20_14_0_20_37_9]PJC57070.1 MAG: sigma-54-dependent Fis family transcriptional regulator [Ignavibacteria bacterium CG_4